MVDELNFINPLLTQSITPIPSFSGSKNKLKFNQPVGVTIPDLSRHDWLNDSSYLLAHENWPKKMDSTQTSFET